MVYKLCTQFMAGHCLIFEIIANDSGKFFEVKKKLRHIRISWENESFLQGSHS